MTSFAFALEPPPQPRLAGGLLLLHAAAAASPWLAQCPPPLAAALSALAVAGFAFNVGRVPGPQCRLQALAADGSGWRARLDDGAGWRPAVLGRSARVWAGCVLVEVRVAGRRAGWLLTRKALPAAMFRRLKARIRLTC